MYCAPARCYCHSCPSWRPLNLRVIEQNRGELIAQARRKRHPYSQDGCLPFRTWAKTVTLRTWETR